LVRQPAGLAARLFPFEQGVALAPRALTTRSGRTGLRIEVGRWGPASLADESSQPLLGSGADHVASLLIDSRNYLVGLLEKPRLAVDERPPA